ncbi:MAG TPA: hypothetical protein PK909_00710 [Sphaerochaeta sp.]|nr:hypothetical protein [Sphaerochaeta sp.]
MIASFQPHIAALLNDQLARGSFSQVSLFGGDRYTLRMSAAIECARALSCTHGGDEDCTCSSCVKFATLSYSDLVIVSQRDHQRRIEAALAAFSHEPNGSWRNRLIQTIRIPLLGFHPILLEEASTGFQNIAARAEGTNNLLYELMTEGTLEEKRSEEYVRDLRKALKDLYSSLPKSTTVSINQVRSIDSWVHQTNISNQLRFIILEGIEQTNVAARNALLKLLEEPPRDVYFFLISEHPSRIMQTILSRSRQYLFPPLSEDAKGRFIASYGLADSNYDSLQSFYLVQSGVDIEESNALVDQLLTSLIGGRALDSRTIGSITAEIEKTNSCEYVLTTLGEAIAKSVLPRRYVAKAVALIDEAYATGLLYNQNQRFTFEALYYRLLEER